MSTQCDSGEMEKEVARWAHPSYMEVQYTALEKENEVLEETIQMMSQNLREVEDELSIVELKVQNANASQRVGFGVEVVDEEIVAQAMAQEREAEWALAERCHAAGEAAAAIYCEHGDEVVAQVGKHKPQCEFSKAERGETSFGLANAVGCTCGYLAKQEKARKKKEGKQ